MNAFTSNPLRTLADIVRFEQEMPLEQRVSARSVFDLFADSAQRHPERIALTLHPDTQATREKVDALVTDAREFDPFELLEPVTQRDRRAAMRMVDGLLSAGEEPVKLVAMLANGLRDLWTARCCRDVAELKQRVGFRPDFVLRRMQEQSSRFSEAEYERLWELLYDTDRRLKSARLPTSEKGELVVQLVIEATLPPL